MIARAARVALAAFAAALVFAAPFASPPPKDRGQYRPAVKDPVLQELEEANAAAEDAAAKVTDDLLAAQDQEEKAREAARRDFRMDLSGLRRPRGPEDFPARAWAFPPVAQYLTGTCWSFATTSFFESEIKRLSGREVKLSELWSVYHEYLDKARRHVATRGRSVFEEGSESEAIPRLWKTYGVVPESAYPGVLAPDGRHNHARMMDELKAYFAYCEANNYWNEDQVLSAVRGILDKHLGRPPERFDYEGRTYTPQAFLKEVAALDVDAYASFVSTSAHPFYTRCELDAEDNWWRADTYVNLPLEEWYALLVRAAQAGSSVAIGGDTSEPGYDGWNKVAVVPTFDVAPGYLDQDAREMRMAEGSTTDDHGIHLVGYARRDGADWFLIKDSARAARKAPPEGWLFYRGDYVKLKMLSYMVHRDFARDVLAKVQGGDAGIPK
ncbi:MAG: C1 family peptidase [Acidobacteriota bacterium]